MDQRSKGDGLIKRTGQHAEGYTTAEAPKRVRQKGPPRHAPNLNPGPVADLEYAPFLAANVEAIIAHVAFPLTEGATRADVLERLNRSAKAHALRVVIDRQPTERTTFEELERLGRSARDLALRLPLLPVPGDPQGEEFAPAPAHGVLWPLEDHLQKAMTDRVAQRRKETVRHVQRRGTSVREENTSLTEEAMFGASTASDLLTILSEAADVLATACAVFVRDAGGRTLDKGPTQTPKATALRDTVHELLAHYSEIFGRKPAISTGGSKGRPLGPALRFVQGALKVMEVETSDENILRISRQPS